MTTIIVILMSMQSLLFRRLRTYVRRPKTKERATWQPRWPTRPRCLGAENEINETRRFEKEFISGVII